MHGATGTHYGARTVQVVYMHGATHHGATHHGACTVQVVYSNSNGANYHRAWTVQVVDSYTHGAI